ncbi:MAG: LysM peptidoglycan-binding domain-containing protein [Dehalococcoidia bacterium]
MLFGLVAAFATGGAAAEASTVGGLPQQVGVSDPGQETHRIQAGDTLGRIAARWGVSVGALAQANGITNPNRVFAGTTLLIPRGWSAATGEQSGNVHRVQPGETLGIIAWRWGTSVQALARTNGIADPDRIYAGQVLTLGGAAAAPVTGAPPSASVAAVPAAAPATTSLREALALSPWPPSSWSTVERIVACESSGNTAAVGPLGHQGLLQVDPRLHGAVPADAVGQLTQGYAVYQRQGWGAWACY